MIDLKSFSSLDRVIKYHEQFLSFTKIEIEKEKLDLLFHSITHKLPLTFSTIYVEFVKNESYKVLSGNAFLSYVTSKEFHDIYENSQRWEQVNIDYSEVTVNIIETRNIKIESIKKLIEFNILPF